MYKQNSFISIMAFTLSITGYTPVLSTNYSPPLELNTEYECALLHFSTFNSIPNIDKRNNKFYYDEIEVIEIPEGSYELQDLIDYLQNNIKNCVLSLISSNNTLKVKLLCSKDINFEKENSCRNLFGFGKETLKANILHESHFPVSILPTTLVRIECDIVSGSFVNGEPRHIIYEFAPNVPPGYRIVEIPKNLIYFPVNQQSISEINIKLLDGENNLVNLRGEEVQLYLHLRKNVRLQ